jgi:hypothetical protein
MWTNELFYLDVLEQLLCTYLPYGFVGFLVYLWFGVWLSRMFLLDEWFVSQPIEN